MRKSLIHPARFSFVALTSTLAFLLVTGGAWASTRSQHVIPPSSIEIPQNAKVGSPIRIVMYGTFPNSCWSALEPTFVQAGNEITVYNNVEVEGSVFCLMVIVPYETRLDLGSLSAGDYKISAFNSRNDTHVFMGDLHVDKAD